MPTIESARLAYVRFKKLPVGHVFIIFRYTDGQEVAVSPEAATAERDTFSLMRGFFKTYRLRYFIREPNAFIRQYLEHGRRVTEHLLDLTQDQLQLLREKMQERTSALETNPEWYHTVFNSCVTSITDHLDDVTGRKRILPSVLFIFAPSRLARLQKTRAPHGASKQ